MTTYICGCEASGDLVAPYCPMHGERRMSHTPGPWSVKSKHARTWISAPKRVDIALMQDIEAETTTANARLIAAAPDLLEACKKAVALYELIIGDHADLDPDNELPRELAQLKVALQKVNGIPQIF